MHARVWIACLDFKHLLLKQCINLNDHFEHRDAFIFFRLGKDTKAGIYVIAVLTDVSN